MWCWMRKRSPMRLMKKRSKIKSTWQKISGMHIICIYTYIINRQKSGMLMQLHNYSNWPLFLVWASILKYIDMIPQQDCSNVPVRFNHFSVEHQTPLNATGLGANLLVLGFAHGGPHLASPIGRCWCRSFTVRSCGRGPPRGLHSWSASHLHCPVQWIPVDPLPLGISQCWLVVD